MRIMGVPLSMCHVYGWDSVADVARHLDQGSAVRRYLNKDKEISDAMMFDGLLLVSDILNRLNHNLAAAFGAWNAPPSPIRRPWEKGKGERIGSGAIPISEFESWYYE